MTKQEVIYYFITLKDTISEDISSILYEDISNSLTFKQLQKVDHLRQRMSTIYKIIEFLEEEVK